MAEKVFVTGAGGFIGKYVTELLARQGYYVVAAIHETSLPINAAMVIKTDISQEAMVWQISKKIGNCKAVIHLAANLDMAGSSQTIRTNCLGTYHIACLANELKAEKCIYLSSVPVIGEPKYLPVTEEHPANPHTLYHITKYAGEQIVRQVCNQGMDRIILRIPSPIGRGMSEKNYLSFLLRKCWANEKIELYGQGMRRQNYVDVRDVASAILCCITQKASDLYLIAGKQEISNRALAFICKERTHSSSEIVWGLREDPEEGNQWILSSRKAEEELGFFPKYEIEETIQWIIGG